MKKILSVALSTAMAFSMFASVAFGADANLSDEQKFNALKEAGIVNGMPDGGSHLEKALSRAELAKIIVKATDLPPVTGVASYKDKGYTAKHWAASFIEAATQAGIMNGKDATKKLFDPTGNVTVQELAKVLTIALKLPVPEKADNTASGWAKGYVAAAVEKGYIPAGINYQANATRSQAIVAAYAIWNASQKPTVKSYKVVDPKNVEFTMSDGEVVKVALEKALEANKETEVKFTYKNLEYTEKVVYKTTVAQKVESVKADNLKQVVVKFDGTVDKASAEEESNYKIDDVEIKKAELSDDKTTVTLLLTKEDGALDNKDETTLKINNVKNEDGTVTFATDIKFTPADVTAPTVKEVVGLGTKAFKVKFSEPITEEEGSVSSNFEIDGGAVGGSVTYVYPDTVIVSANLSVGSHKVSISDVEDFSGLKVAPVDHSFEVVEDTKAPEIVSVETNDLTELTITFNETIKDIDDVYVNTSSNNAESIDIDDNKVTVKLDDKSPMNYNKNSVHVKGVRDYSDNKADRESEVTPTLDTIRPIITKSEVDMDGSDYIVTLTFSEKVREDDVKDLDNYVLKDEDGKIVDEDFIDKDGHPTNEVDLKDIDDNKVIVNLGSALDKDEVYKLEVSGIGDRAYVRNVMMPQTIEVDTGKAGNDTFERAWVDKDYLYLQFSTDLATDGNGSARDKDKFTLVDTDGKRYSYDGTVNIYNADSIRLEKDDFDGKEPAKGMKIEVAYIANKDGDLIKDNGSSVLVQTISDKATDKLFDIVVNDSEVVDVDEVKIKFSAKVNSSSAKGFEVDGKQPNSSSLSSDGKTLTLKFNNSNELSKDGAYILKITSTSAASDVYGNKLTSGDTYTLQDKIKPEPKGSYFNVEKIEGVTDAVYFDIALTEGITINNFNSDYVNGLFKVKVGSDTATVTAVTYGKNNDNTVLRLRVNASEASLSGKKVTVEYDTTKGVIYDRNKNDLDDFTAYKR